MEVKCQGGLVPIAWIIKEWTGPTIKGKRIDQRAPFLLYAGKPSNSRMIPANEIQQRCTGAYFAYPRKD